MDVDRRTVVKGMAAGGALLAFGVPRWALAEAGGPAPPQGCTLLLGGSESDAAFACGARAVLVRAGCPERALAASAGGPLAAPGALRAQLVLARGTRWIAVLDDAGAAIFQELVRGVEGRLLSRGHHAIAPGDTSEQRHAWVGASPKWAAAALLADCLAADAANVTIDESFLAHAAMAPRTTRDGLLTHSPDAAECVGQAVAACALGLGAGRRPPGGSAPPRFAGAPAPPMRRFVSFVVDL